MTNATTQDLAGRDLISDGLFARLTKRIVSDDGGDLSTAERVVDQALAYLATCARTTEPLSPSRMVDLGWHTFILYTREYAAFCQRVAGRFIHHVPSDSGPPTPTAGSRERTVAAIRAAGYRIDPDLWTSTGTCTQCSEGCTHSGGGGGECHFRPEREWPVASAG